MQPLYNRVYIRRIKASDETINGIIVHPGTDHLEEFLKGEIVAIGNQVTDEVKVGDIVGFRKTVGKKINIDFEELLMVRDTEIDFVYLSL
jgi:co-chaperonin GroES (HSP10)